MMRLYILGERIFFESFETENVNKIVQMQKELFQMIQKLKGGVFKIKLMGYMPIAVIRLIATLSMLEVLIH